MLTPILQTQRNNTICSELYSKLRGQLQGQKSILYLGGDKGIIQNSEQVL